MVESLVLDASTVVEALAGTSLAPVVRARVEHAVWHAPAHVDAEVLSALGRLCRAGHLTASQVAKRLTLLTAMPLRRHALAPLLPGAWQRRATLRLVDALYVELADRLQAPLVTTDRRLARAAPNAEGLAP